MFTTAALAHLLQTYGLALLFPIAILEGPIVTVIAAYFARLGYLNIFAVYGVCVLADLVGDAGFYALGRAGPRFLPAHWLARIGGDEARLAALVAHFKAKGGRTILIGKVTHSAGFLVLLAAGAARMRFWSFLWYNLVGTVPKTLFFTIVGYTIGHAYASINGYIGKVSVVMLVALGAAALLWFIHSRGRKE